MILKLKLIFPYTTIFCLPRSISIAFIASIASFKLIIWFWSWSIFLKIWSRLSVDIPKTSRDLIQVSSVSSFKVNPSVPSVSQFLKVMSIRSSGAAVRNNIYGTFFKKYIQPKCLPDKAPTRRMDKIIVFILLEFLMLSRQQMI